jgi:hypothetical protein
MTCPFPHTLPYPSFHLVFIPYTIIYNKQVNVSVLLSSVSSRKLIKPKKGIMEPPI